MENPLKTPKEASTDEIELKIQERIFYQREAFTCMKTTSNKK